MAASQAEQFTQTTEHVALLKDLSRVSAASKSESRHDRDFADGSSLVYTSRQGGPATFTLTLPSGLIVPPKGPA